ncbi:MULTISPECIES: flavodoxin-dependent (E)-4-hydroxy-3-methylbut-2-enyl-diphosphate synthase [unclassified Candidatus Frackibacter]|uniref:flavodoxin-dependent (E)-4-hydroxy-3-methylbut-2-enyl-diphosphate synthase n=1 Tax=unclassified Candidatus Frackibacter TaxID=2648818 RepID=UPI00088174E5|nr:MULTISPECIES: flavodoxin-dependent (E)-4-hydroxy-3-methylbut-2-enyl-diphosphate synthase [unclassified Candidatus Frackibacter]SDB98655.1 4-hydroxy-3-methylbut-2-en-1-yl diphosphate synthase [Candidatus Frackibacter sp. WG11]SEM30468.1 4-hydroxy-3-methylbut-2-en-1-yl diphosphate synthase [Candidatus Frackibacter sp. WG12]SFL35383.1 4-hydroxy-3-methylbut-2-en-1-yl diphosphate synthase [Candidatus Frackibacter sp. WG13]
MARRDSKQVSMGGVKIGGDAPISVQSMTNTDTRDVEATVRQIHSLEEVGCELIRIAVPDMVAANKVDKIKAKINIPLIADIHFNHKLALRVLELGIDGLRINPGNIGSEEKVRELAKLAKDKGVPIRIGVNAGSLEKELLVKYGAPTAEAMVESALRHVRLLEEYEFTDIIISLKSSDVLMTLRAYQLMADKVDYPLHLGITEAGTEWAGTIKSAVGLGSILSRGLGDTIRVSLTGDPVEEVKVGYEILKSLGLRQKGPQIISCPTCGRCEINLIDVANEVESKIRDLDTNIKVAIMGCVVNGPGEAREADIGIAGGKKEGLLFKEGEVVKKVAGEELVDTLLVEVEAEADAKAKAEE